MSKTRHNTVRRSTRSIGVRTVKHKSVVRSYAGLIRTAQENIWKASSHCAVESQKFAFVRLLFHVQAVFASNVDFRLPSCRAHSWRSKASAPLEGMGKRVSIRLKTSQSIKNGLSRSKWFESPFCSSVHSQQSRLPDSLCH